MARDLGLRVASKQEIMAHMTTVGAVNTVLGMNRTHTSPELMSLIENELGKFAHGSSGHHAFAKRGFSTLQSALRGASNPTGYSAMDKAVNMLNDMVRESQNTLESEGFRCGKYDRETLEAMSAMREAVRTFNSEAAEARGQVVSAQGQIATLGTQLVQTNERFDTHKKDCIDELDEMNAELKIVLADIQVMGRILQMTDCDQKLFLVQCSHCGIMLQHEPIQQALGKLRSSTAKQIMQETLATTYEESVHAKALALTQEQVEHMKTRSSYTVVPLPVGGVNVSDVPTAVQPFDCQPTNKCTIGSSPNCQKLKDRFLAVQAGIVDRRDELEGMIYSKQNFCEEADLMYTAQIDAMNTKLREEQAKLAEGTDNQNTAEQGSHQKSNQHDETAVEYTKTMQECCDNQNTAKSELCALEKIRGELLKIEGKSVTSISDCEVSEWSNEECSATCGGGTMTKSRSVVTQPEGGGMECPPLEMVESCNTHVCPTDCKLSDWGGWSSCSAECGGGVLERTRSVEVEARHGGNPCEETEEDQACKIQSCDADCDLTEWSQWGSCSKQCDGGTQRRTKTIKTPKTGAGKCWEADDDERLEFKDCNDFECSDILDGTGRDTLSCISKVDVVILLDGSGSLGSRGWRASKVVASKLITALGRNSSEVWVALQVFSGPKKWKGFEKCTQAHKASDPAIDMEADCGIRWESHFTNDTETLAEDVHELEWPRATTLTSVALGQAESELVKGRDDANSVVIVITDGKPMSNKNTKAAARKLQEHAKLLWIPVGRNAPIKMIKKMATKPEKDHVIKIRNFNALEQAETVNKIVSATCPIVM